MLSNLLKLVRYRSLIASLEGASRGVCHFLRGREVDVLDGVGARVLRRRWLLERRVRGWSIAGLEVDGCLRAPSLRTESRPRDLLRRENACLDIGYVRVRHCLPQQIGRAHV